MPYMLATLIRLPLFVHCPYRPLFGLFNFKERRVSALPPLKRLLRLLLAPTSVGLPPYSIAPAYY
eukprot:2112736-Pleurochrysis_carterae.AAC.1